MKTPLSKFGIFIFAFLLFTSSAHASTIWYSNSLTGSDTTGNGALGNPFKTFTKSYASSTAGDTINLTGTFSWTDSGETGTTSPAGYTISKNLTITGQSAGGASTTIVEAATASTSAQSRVFTISSGVTATIENLNIMNGRTKVGYGYYGSGVQNNGTLYLIADEIDNNISDNGGAGVDNLDLLYMASSTVDHNLCNGSASMGCGVLSDYYIVAGGYTTIVDSTIAYNTITADTGYYSGAGVHFRNGSGTLTNDTIAYNASCESAVGMDTTSGVLTIKNTIIADNLYESGSYCTSGIPVNFAYRGSGRGNVADNGGNIIGYSYYYTTWTATGDWYDSAHTGIFKQQTTNATGTVNLSATLADNSSLYGTPTLALSAGSIAIDNGGTGANGATSTVPTTDERGATRAGAVDGSGFATDIGAYEYNGTFVVADITPTLVFATTTLGSATSTTATISWTTASAASSQVFFGPASGLTTTYGSSTAEIDTSPRVTSHTVTFGGLIPCAVYHYEVESRTAGGDSATSSDQTFVTVGCTGSSAISATAVLTIATSTGGTLAQGVLTLTVPSAFTATSSSLIFQVNKLDGEAFLDASGLPSNMSAATSTVFDIKAFIDATTTVTTFAKPVTVQLSYSTNDVAGLDTSTLKIYRYDSVTPGLAGVWTALDSCSTDTNAMTVTCTTTNFSSFAIFGQEATTPSTPSNTTATSTISVSASSGGNTVQSRYANLIAMGFTAQAEQLKNQYAYVFATTSPALSIASTSSMMSPNFTFTRFLQRGMQGADVLQLQKFLNAEGFTLATTGAGSPGNETDYFGSLTATALAKFQTTHASEILAPIGLSVGTGNFGYYTMMMVNKMI